jgi:aldehyde:ferredoxin oxidoreductase
LLVTPLEYETLTMMGSNLGIGDPDVIAKLNSIANDIGVDTIEVGVALGLAAQAGYMEFGDGKRALELMLEVAKGTPLGRIIGNGAAITGEVLGINRIPTVKRQAIPGYDPRAIKGTGVTYATSPQGADHTCGLTIRANVKHTDPKGQVYQSRDAQYRMAGYDTLGVCIFGSFGMSPDIVRDLINARYGWDIDSEYLNNVGREAIMMERLFNQEAGLTKNDDRLPKWMTWEKLPGIETTFDFSDEELDVIFDVEN